MERDDGKTGFYIDDNADPALKVTMRMMAFAAAHEEFLQRMTDSLEGDDIVITTDEFNTISTSIQQTREDMLSIYDDAMAKDKDSVDSDDLIEPLTHLDGLLLGLIRFKPRQVSTPTSH